MGCFCFHFLLSCVRNRGLSINIETSGLAARNSRLQWLQAVKSTLDAIRGYKFQFMQVRIRAPQQSRFQVFLGHLPLKEYSAPHPGNEKCRAEQMSLLD